MHREKQLQKWRKSNEFQRDKCELAELTSVGGEKWHFTDILNNTVILESWKLLGYFQQERRWEGLEEMTLLLWGKSNDVLRFLKKKSFYSHNALYCNDVEDE